MNSFGRRGRGVRSLSATLVAIWSLGSGTGTALAQTAPVNCKAKVNCTVPVSIAGAVGACSVMAPSSITVSDKTERIIWKLDPGWVFGRQGGNEPGIRFRNGAGLFDADGPQRGKPRLTRRLGDLKTGVQYQYDLSAQAVGGGSCKDGGPMIINRD